MRQRIQERLGGKMGNLILFVNTFLSYLLLMAIIVALCAVAIFIGIKLRKNKNKQLAGQDSSADA